VSARGLGLSFFPTFLPNQVLKYCHGIVLFSLRIFVAAVNSSRFGPVVNFVVTAVSWGD